MAKGHGHDKHSSKHRKHHSKPAKDVVEVIVERPVAPVPVAGPWSEWALDPYGRYIYRCRQKLDGLDYEFRGPVPAYARRSLPPGREISPYYASLVMPIATRGPTQEESKPARVVPEQAIAARPKPSQRPEANNTPRPQIAVRFELDDYSDGGSDERSNDNMVVALPGPQRPELGIAWDKRSRRRIEAEKGKRISARSKVHGWLPSLE